MFSKMLLNICLVFFKFFTCIGSSLVFYAWGLIIFPKVTCLFQNDYRAASCRLSLYSYLYVCFYFCMYGYLFMYIRQRVWR